MKNWVEYLNLLHFLNTWGFSMEEADKLMLTTLRNIKCDLDENIVNISQLSTEQACVQKYFEFSKVLLFEHFHIVLCKANHLYNSSLT